MSEAESKELLTLRVVLADALGKEAAVVGQIRAVASDL